MQEYKFTVNHERQGKRLDVFLTENIREISRSQVQKLIAEGNVTVNDAGQKSNYKLRNGDLVRALIPVPEPLKVEAEPIPLDVVYEDQDLIIINKPQGMVVHPANGNYRGTLVNALLFHCRDLSGINGVLRPGIVHRIDKDTSGLLVVAKNDKAHLSLAKQIKEHTVKREYIALVHGIISEPGGIVDAPIGRDPQDRQKMAVELKNSKNAVTKYLVLERFSAYTLVECQLKTGRTHQIRVHMSYLGHPVVGDPKYGPRKAHLGFKGQALHAKTLGFHHPRSGKWLEFSVDVPKEFADVLRELRHGMETARKEEC